MRRPVCWITVVLLALCAALYTADAFGFRTVPAPTSPMRAPEHGLLYVAAVVVFVALSLLAVVLPRVAGAFGVLSYLLVLVLQLALVGDRARDYNVQHGLLFGDPQRQMPLHLVTDAPMWHLLRLGLPILAIAAALARADKARDADRLRDPYGGWRPAGTV